jgi:hypothetical protein
VPSADRPHVRHYAGAGLAHDGEHSAQYVKLAKDIGVELCLDLFTRAFFYTSSEDVAGLDVDMVSIRFTCR